MKTVSKHFVTFFSPGTFVSETTEKPIDSWDVAKARKMAAKVTERHGATPYAFQFSTRSRGDDDLDSKVTKTSGMYFLPHCKIETIKEIKARGLDNERILLDNMKCNGWERVVTTTSGWKITLPLEKNDVVLE